MTLKIRWYWYQMIRSCRSQRPATARANPACQLSQVSKE